MMEKGFSVAEIELGNGLNNMQKESFRTQDADFKIIDSEKENKGQLF
jgi:hypothetical protein